MDSLREIRIIDLLGQREEQWQKIAAVEAHIRGLLDGCDYPFPAPPELPSAAKVKRKRAAKAGASKQARQSALRELSSPDENAYRIVYAYNGAEKESFQDDCAFVKQLLEFPVEAFEIRRIESVLYRGEQDWQTQELLWSRQPKF